MRLCLIRFNILKQNSIIMQLPLNREWTLWFDSPNLHKSYKEYSRELSWKQNLCCVYKINSIPTFWQTYNNITEPNNMCYKSAYYLFVSNTAPHSMDINNLNGTTLCFNILKGNNLNNIWLRTVLLFLGENIKYSEYINGISLKKNKKQYELTLWTKTKNPDICNFFINYFTRKYNEEI